MKKLALLLVVVALLIATAGSAAAGEPCRRVVLPTTGLSVAIQPLEQTSTGWEEPNHVTAWILAPWPQAIFLHRNGPGADLVNLKSGDPIILHWDWGAADAPLRLRVTGVQVIAAEDEERVVLDRVGGGLFALITCHPAGNPEAPQRLVVWATTAQTRRTRGLWR